jgi:hypothetical protein
MAKWLKNVGLLKLTNKSTFTEFCGWRSKVEAAFSTCGISPQSVSPTDLCRIAFMFLSETFHRHLEQEGILGTKRWLQLLRHLEAREFDFTFRKL